MMFSTGLFGKRFHQRISYFLAALIALTTLFVGVPDVQATPVTWVGEDLGGQNLILNDGDILSGTFTNIGRFVIDSGITVYGGSSFVSVDAHEIVINGIFIGGPTPSPNLDLIAEISFTLGGALDQWDSVKLIGDTISLLEGSSINSSLTLMQPILPAIRTPGTSFAGGTISIGRGPGIGSGIRGITYEGPSGGVFLEVPKIIGEPLILTPPDFSGFNAGGALVLQPVPEPSTLILMALGLGLAAALRRSKEN